MNKTKVCFFSLIILAYFSCATKSSNLQPIHITKMACLGNCPVYTLDIYPNGKMVFNGKSNTKFEGFITKYLDWEELTKIHNLFDKIDFKNLKSEYQIKVFDYPVTLITYMGKKVKLKNYEAVPVELKMFLVEIERLLRDNNCI